MKASTFLLGAIWFVSSHVTALAENEAPAKANNAANAPSPVNETRKAEPSATSSTAPQTTDLARRIQGVTNNKSAIVLAIANMADAGVEASVIEAYAQNATVPALKSDEILFLHEHRVSAQAITALIKRSSEIRTQQIQTQKESADRLALQQNYQAATVAPQPSVPPPSPAPATYNYYVAPPAAYNYAYPAYTYAYPALSYYSYARPYPTTYYSSACPPSYAARYNNFYYSHNPHTSLSVGIHTPRSTSFFASRWNWNGTTGKPVDLYR